MQNNNMEQIYIPKQKYKVLCFCITYNQSKYIEDTLNGFAMQKTNFPFACLVVDDCSTDGEQEAIKAWLNENCDMQKAEYIDLELSNVILVPHKSNKNCTFAIYLLKRNLWKEPTLKGDLVNPWRYHHGYEAWCEGDDYWIEPNKLQMQVDYLEAHSECQYVFTGRYVDKLDEQIRIEHRYKDRVYTTHDILSGFNPGIQNVCYRATLTADFTKYTGINADRLYPYCASLKGKIEYIDEITSVYRVTGNGISTSVNKEDWFVHAATDFLNFHKSTNSKDHAAYIEGMAKYAGGYIRRCRFIQKINCVKNIHNELVKSNAEITYFDCVYILYYVIKKRIYRLFGIGDIYIKLLRLS